jgi:hypothetical protein
MLSALIPSKHSYSAMQLASQQIHQRFVQPGPLVLGSALLKFLTPTIDRDRTVSRRSEPSSRATLMGEQPNPWDLLQPQDDMSSWGRSACYPRSTFYPLSDGPSMRNHRITMLYFRTCSTCRSCSQAPLYHYALRTITKRAEGTFRSLRYFFGGDHPSQTTHHAMSPIID